MPLANGRLPLTTEPMVGRTKVVFCAARIDVSTNTGRWILMGGIARAVTGKSTPPSRARGSGNDHRKVAVAPPGAASEVVPFRIGGNDAAGGAAAEHLYLPGGHKERGGTGAGVIERRSGRPAVGGAVVDLGRRQRCRAEDRAVGPTGLQESPAAERPRSLAAARGRHRPGAAP